MSLGNDEKKFIELREGFVAELNEINQQLDELMARQSILVALLDGRLENNELIETKEVSESRDPRDSLDEALVSFIAVEGPVKRPAIQEFLENHWEIYSKDITRALERCKRRGLIKVNGKSKAAVWTAVR